MAKAIICGADLVTINLPLLIALECRLCESCEPGQPCPARLNTLDPDFAVGRMTNLIAAWHDQLIEVMGAMGMREVRRLRGDVGRAMFFEQRRRKPSASFMAPEPGIEELLPRNTLKTRVPQEIVERVTRRPRPAIAMKSPGTWSIAARTASFAESASSFVPGRCMSANPATVILASRATTCASGRPAKRPAMIA